MPKYIPRVINTRNHSKKPKKKVKIIEPTSVVDELEEFKKHNTETLLKELEKVATVEEKPKKKRTRKKRKVNIDPVVEQEPEVIPEPLIGTIEPDQEPEAEIVEEEPKTEE